MRVVCLIGLVLCLGLVACDSGEAPLADDSLTPDVTEDAAQPPSPDVRPLHLDPAVLSLRTPVEAPPPVLQPEPLPEIVPEPVPELEPEPAPVLRPEPIDLLDPCGDLEAEVAAAQNSTWHVVGCDAIIAQPAPATELPKLTVNQNLGDGELGDEPGQTPIRWRACAEWTGTLQTNPCVAPYLLVGQRFGLPGEVWNPDFLKEAFEPEWYHDPIEGFAALQDRLFDALRLDEVLDPLLTIGAAKGTARFSAALEHFDNYQRAHVVLWHPMLGSWDGELYLPLDAAPTVGFTLMLHGHEFPSTRYALDGAADGHGLESWGSDFGAQELARRGRATLVMAARPYLAGYDAETFITRQVWETAGVHIVALTLLEDLIALAFLRKLVWTDAWGKHAADPEDFTLFGHSAGGHRARILATVYPPTRLSVDYDYSATSFWPPWPVDEPHCETIPGGGGALEAAMGEPWRFPFDTLTPPYYYEEFHPFTEPQSPPGAFELVMSYLEGWSP